MSHDGHPGPQLSPLPAISSTCPAFTNSATATHSYKMRRSRQPKMDPFTAEGCRYNQKHSSPSLCSLYTLTPSLLCLLSLCLSVSRCRRIQNSLSHLCFLSENFIIIPCPHHLLLLPSFSKRLPLTEQSDAPACLLILGMHEVEVVFMLLLAVLMLIPLIKYHAHIFALLPSLFSDIFLGMSKPHFKAFLNNLP